MEYIHELFSLAQDYWILTMIVGVFSAFVESFLPILPLIAIVTINAAIFGMGTGLLISWIGSSLGTAALFLIISKYNSSKLFNNLRNKKTYRAISWLEKQGFKLFFIIYSCPFVPGCLVTIALAFCKKSISSFLPAMMSGKFVMFLVVSYVGSDIRGFFTHPAKIVIFILLVLLSWKIGNKFNLKLEQNHDEKDDTNKENINKANKELQNDIQIVHRDENKINSINKIIE